MSSILEFIRVFQSESNISLFTDIACYWFATILHQRFSGSSIVYNPDKFHFATKIQDEVYDITGVVDDKEDYVDWKSYSTHQDDAHIIIRTCINLERR